MNGIAFRIYVDAGLCVWVCRITRRHHFLPSSYRDESCIRCSLIRGRIDR